MSYLSGLNSTQKNNINIITNEAKAQGITNPLAIAGIISIASKESDLKSDAKEISYGNTSVARIRQVFPSKVKHLSDAEINVIKKDPVKWYNTIYGTVNGNKGGNDGWNYRGRGFNQLTGRGNYSKYGRLTGYDLINKPQQLDDPTVASKVFIEFMKQGIDSLKRQGKLQAYNSTGINDFKTKEDAVMAFYHANAGTGKSTGYIKKQSDPSKDKLGGMTKALSRVGEFISESVDEAIDTVKKKPIIVIGAVAVITVSSWALIKYLRK